MTVFFCVTTDEPSSHFDLLREYFNGDPDSYTLSRHDEMDFGQRLDRITMKPLDMVIVLDDGWERDPQCRAEAMVALADPDMGFWVFNDADELVPIERAAVEFYIVTTLGGSIIRETAEP